MRHYLAISALGLTGAIFLVDVYTPIGLTFGILYVVPVYLVGMTPQRRILFTVAITCTLLNFLVFHLSPPGGLLYVAIFNHCLIDLAFNKTDKQCIQYRFGFWFVDIIPVVMQLFAFSRLQG